MKQTMKPNVSRDDSEDDDLCRSVQFRGLPFLEGESHLPNFPPSSVNGDIQRFMGFSSSKQDEHCSTLCQESGEQIYLPWGRLVVDRNSVPDLMSEEVDEEIEQFMVLPLKEANESSPYRHKRRHSNDQHLSNLDGGSPTSKQQRTHTDTCCHSCDLQEEVARWFQETFGCGKTDVDSSCLEEKQQEQWIEHWKCPDGMPAPRALRRQSPFAREKAHPKMLEREALLPPSPPGQDCNEKQQALSLQDSHHAMSLPFVNRFDTHDGDRHGEGYLKEQVQIHGNDSSHDSLRNVHAAVYPCVGCGQCLVANKGTKLLYCQRCGTLAPIDVLKEAKED